MSASQRFWWERLLDELGAQGRGGRGCFPRPGPWPGRTVCPSLHFLCRSGGHFGGVLGSGGKASCLLKSRPELQLFPKCQLILWLSLHRGSLALLSKEARWPPAVSRAGASAGCSHAGPASGLEAGILISLSDAVGKVRFGETKLTSGRVECNAGSLPLYGLSLLGLQDTCEAPALLCQPHRWPVVVMSSGRRCPRRGPHAPGAGEPAFRSVPRPTDQVSTIPGGLPSLLSSSGGLTLPKGARPQGWGQTPR